MQFISANNGRKVDRLRRRLHFCDNYKSVTVLAKIPFFIIRNNYINFSDGFSLM